MGIASSSVEVCYDSGEFGEDPTCMAYDMSQEPLASAPPLRFLVFPKLQLVDVSAIRMNFQHF